MSLTSRITKVTQNFDIFSDVPWQHGFPEGSNVNAIGETGIPTTRQFLSFHLRRAILSFAHALVKRYADDNRIGHGKLLSRVISRLLDAVEAISDGTTKVVSLEDFSKMELSKVPPHIAVSLQLASDETPPAKGEPADPVERLLEQAADLVSWVALTPHVDRLTIYEQTDALHKINRDKLESTIRDRAKASGYPTKELDISFATEHHIVFPNKLAVVFATDVLQGHSCQAKFGIIEPKAVGEHLLGTEQLPDLFISFNSQSNGFPLAALNNAMIYESQRKGILGGGKPQLRDYVRALKSFEAAT